MDAADELIILVGRGDIGDFNRVGELMDRINRQNVKQGDDFLALEKGKKYIREMQKLLDEQK